MQLIIQFAYTGNVSVTEDVVQDLLFAADQLLVIGVIHACWDFLEEHLSPENCIGIWQFTKICYYPRLQRKSYQYIIDNFEEVSCSTEWSLLSVEEISGIFARDNLIVRHEKSVYNALHQWITQAPEGRKEHLAWLFSKVWKRFCSFDFPRMKLKEKKCMCKKYDMKLDTLKAPQSILC